MKQYQCLICGEKTISWFREKILRRWWCKECDDMQGKYDDPNN